MSRRALALLALVALDFFTLAAFLGQVDWQLSYWYSAPNATWQFPWGRYRAVIAWELEYAVILACAAMALVLGFLLGRELARG